MPTETKLTVIIPTYNPQLLSLNEVIEALKQQTLPLEDWELIIIDNNSTNDSLNNANFLWHPNSRIVKEEKQGLTYGRIKGFKDAKGGIIVMVDDDNILSADYLQLVMDHFFKNKDLGTIGGKIGGRFIGFTPPEWTKQFWSMLAIRDLGNEIQISSSLADGYPAFAPVGAGMAVRKNLLNEYITSIEAGHSTITDRIGTNLSSGGDNEINISILKQGHTVGYFPDLLLEHIIPKERLTKKYLARLNYQSTRSWMQLLLKHDICPWPTIAEWSVMPRKIKAWFDYGAWKSPVNYIKWMGACGMYEGLSVK